MTKYSGKAMNDEYEPEEGEIQDDDEPIEEARLFGKGSTTIARGKESGGRSNSFSLFRGDVSKSSNRKQDSSFYGSKHSLPGLLEGTSPTSPSTSRTRFRTTGMHSWYHQNRQNSTSSKERNVWKAASGIKERERQMREKSRTSRNQYHSSFFNSTYEQRHASPPCPPTAYFSTPIPQWHWYSKQFKEMNKKINSFVNFSDKETPGCQLNETTNMNPSPKHSNTQKNNTRNPQERELMKQTSSRPDSPASSDSIEIIEVPRKVPEVITIDDSEDEQHTLQTKVILNVNEIITPADKLVMNSDVFPSTLIKQCLGANTIQHTIHDNPTPETNLENNTENIQHHLKELTLALKNKYDERKKEEISKRNSNSNEISCKTSGCSGFSSCDHQDENNLPIRHMDPLSNIAESCGSNFSIPVNDYRSNIDKSIANTNLDHEKIINSEQYEMHGHGKNSQDDIILFKNMPYDRGVQSSIQSAHSSYNAIQSSPSNSSCSISNQKAPSGYVIGDEECSSVGLHTSGHTTSDCSTSVTYEQKKESYIFPNIKSLLVSNNEQTKDLLNENTVLPHQVNIKINDTINSLHVLHKNSSSENVKLSNSQSNETPSRDNHVPLETLLSDSQKNMLSDRLQLGINRSEYINTSDTCNINHTNELTNTQNSDVDFVTFVNVRNPKTSENRIENDHQIESHELVSHQAKHFGKSQEINRDCSPGTSNALTRPPKSDEMNISIKDDKLHKSTDICSEFVKENVEKKLHGSEVQDCITLSKSSHEDSSVRSTIMQVDELQSVNNSSEDICHFHLTEKVQDFEDISSGNKDGIEEDVVGNSNDFNDVETTLKASSIAALKRRASQLKKLQGKSSETNCAVIAKKSGNQKLIPSVVIHRQLRDAVASVTSESHSLMNFLPSHGNGEKNDKMFMKHTVPVTPCSVISGNSLPSSEEKHATYSPPMMIYEDRVGTKNDENTNFREQVISRVNVTVPEFIISLGKDSDSGDDSDENSDISHPAKIDLHGTYPGSKGDTSGTHVTTEFEKKLDVLLKQARFQQESNPTYGKENAGVDESPGQSLTHSESQNNISSSESTSLVKNVQSLSVSEGCARAMPRSTVKKIVCSRVAKSKVVNHKIKSVVVKNSCGNFPHDRINHDDKTSKQFTSPPMNGNKQPAKNYNVNTNRGKVTRRTSSTADIGLLSPLKQKEYMKLKRQLVQMTQKKKDNQSTERCEHVASLNISRKEDKDEEMKLKEAAVRTVTIENNVPEVVEEPFICEQESSRISRTPVVKPGKLLTHDPNHDNLVINVGNEMSVPETNNIKNGYQVFSSKCYPCSRQQVPETNTMDKEIHVLSPEINNSIHSTKIDETDNISESCGDNIFQHSLPYTSTFQEKDCTFQHRYRHSPNGLKEQAVQPNTNHSDIVTKVSRKRNISDSDLALKKQKIGKAEDETYATQLHDSALKESINVNERKLVEDLWSSETKLIARRRQVLEDIASVHLHVHKIEAVNFRTDQIIKNIHKLKEDLKQAEQQFSQEKECLKTLNTRVCTSRQSIQRGQSELLSLSLECEEIGCKVHGPNYNVPNTCVDLIRNEMMAMTEAMQELENQKNAMEY